MMHRKQSFQNPMPNTPVPLPPNKRGPMETNLESEQQASVADGSESVAQPQSDTTSQASLEHTGMFTSTTAIAYIRSVECDKS
jgi:hypothetical protein